MWAQKEFTPTRWSRKGPGEVLGMVREYGTDKSVADAEVTLEAPEPGPGKVLVVKTTADGSFRFERVPNYHDWKLRIAPRPPLDGIDTGGIEVVENVATDLGILYLPPKFRVSGIVMDARGKGVEGALVRAVRRRTESATMGFNFMKLIREKHAVVVLVTKKTTNQGMGWASLRAALEDISVGLP